MVSVKQRRQLESWLTRAAKLEKDADVQCTVSGAVYRSSFECYAKAYEIDSSDRQIWIKLYELWPSRPPSDWRTVALDCMRPTGDVRAGDVRIPMDKVIRNLIQGHLVGPPRLHFLFQELSAISTLSKSEMAAYCVNVIMENSLDSYMIYMIRCCDFNEKFDPKVREMEPTIVDDWLYWHSKVKYTKGDMTNAARIEIQKQLAQHGHIVNHCHLPTAFRNYTARSRSGFHEIVGVFPAQRPQNLRCDSMRQSWSCAVQ